MDLSSTSEKLLSKLKESEIKVKELSSLLAQSELSLQACEDSLRVALSLTRAHSAELWLVQDEMVAITVCARRD
jgi:hypothetical protein